MGFNLKFVHKKTNHINKFFIVCFTLLITAFQVNAQRKNVYGNVFAFKNLALKRNLEKSIVQHPDQNFEYYNYADIFSAISKIYASNYNIRVAGKEVFVRKEKNTFSAVPASFIIKGRRALEINYILKSNIETIEIIPDGSSKYGPCAANGVVIVTTIQNK